MSLSFPISIISCLKIKSQERDWYSWHTVSITGGEPLCRSDLNEILKKLYDEDAKITLITNGSLLAKHLDICSYLEKLTVSVHTTDNSKYQNIIGVPFNFDSLKENLNLVRKTYPKTNIRFNSTIVKDVNSSESSIFEIIRFAKNLGASIKFIELLPNSKEDEENFVSIDEIEIILKKHNFMLIENGLLQRIYFDGESIIVLAKIVCSSADGTIKPCMRNSFEINVLDEIKNRDIVGFKKKIKIFFNTVSILCPYEK